MRKDKELSFAYLHNYSLAVLIGISGGVKTPGGRIGERRDISGCFADWATVASGHSGHSQFVCNV